MLRIGDTTADGSLRVVDEDRLCYKVFSSSNGATGIRTISKDLLNEWIDAVKSDPHSNAISIRKKISGKSGIDKYEYGYNATLYKLALMALGKEPVVNTHPFGSGCVPLQPITYGAPGEEVMNRKMKSNKPTQYEGGRKPLSFDPKSKDDELLLRLLSALRAKPFVILAGHSGTGKSRYVKKLAYMTCKANELRAEGQLPGNYLLLQVKPNWHDSTDLLGFRNAMEGNKYQKTALIEFIFRAYHFEDTPFFLCLDEMNLAPIEQYFAEFLSAMESKEPVPLNDITTGEDNLYELGCEWTDALEYLKTNKFSIPKNLFIVGTVNMDETTNQFSRKVLDRAFTIEMSDVDFKHFGTIEEPSYADTIDENKIQALLNGEKLVEKLDEDDVRDDSPLVKIQKSLAQTAFAIAYRFANEYTLLKKAIECFDPEKKMGLDALDQAVLMKILPRIAGEKDYIENIYGRSENEGLRKALDGKKASLEKIKSLSVNSP